MSFIVCIECSVAQPALFSDDFAGESIDTNKWTVFEFNGGYAAIESNSLTINHPGQAGQGAFVTSKAEFTPPYKVSGTFKSFGIAGVSIRANGSYHPIAYLDPLGIGFGWYYGNNLGVVDIREGASPYTTLFDSPATISAYDMSLFHSFDIYDWGSRIRVDMDGKTVADFSVDPSLGVGRQIVLTDGDNWSGGPSEPTLFGPIEVNSLNSSDTDGDSVNDYREIADGTNPNDATSFNPLSKGLVAYYPFNGNANDESGNGNNGTINGASSATDRTGLADSAVAFGGSNHITVSDSTQLKPNKGSISFWVKANSWSTSDGLADLIGKDGNESGRQYVLQAFPDGRIRSAVFTGDGTLNYSDSTVVAATNTWHHITQVWEGTSQSAYLNGILIAASPAVGNLAQGSSPVQIGGNPLVGSSLDGSMDDVRIYNRALNSSDVEELFYAESFSDAQKQFLVSAPRVMGHFSQADYNLNRTNGQTDVTTNPSAFNLFTQSEYDSFGALQFSNGISSVISNPAAFNLFTEAEFNSNRTAGQSDVISNPMSYGLYTPDSIMDLRMGGLMIQRQGTNAVVFFQPQTTTDLTQPFTNNGTPITHEIPMPGNKGFIRINAKP